MSFNITTYRYSCNFQMLPCEQIHAHPDQMSGKLHAWWESAAWTQTHSQRKTLRSGFSWSWERGSPLVLQLATVRSASALQLVTVSNRWAPESCEDIEVGPHQWQHFQRRGILNTSTITLSRSARQKSICHRTAMMINCIVYVTRIFVHWRRPYVSWMFTPQDLLSHEPTFWCRLWFINRNLYQRVGSRDNKFSGVNIHEIQGLLERILAIIIQIELQKYTRVWCLIEKLISLFQLGPGPYIIDEVYSYSKPLGLEVWHTDPIFWEASRKVSDKHLTNIHWYFVIIW